MDASEERILQVKNFKYSKNWSLNGRVHFSSIFISLDNTCTGVVNFSLELIQIPKFSHFSKGIRSTRTDRLIVLALVQTIVNNSIDISKFKPTQRDASSTFHPLSFNIKNFFIYPSSTYSPYWIQISTISSIILQLQKISIRVIDFCLSWLLRI